MMQCSFRRLQKKGNSRSIFLLVLLIPLMQQFLVLTSKRLRATVDHTEALLQTMNSGKQRNDAVHLKENKIPDEAKRQRVVLLAGPHKTGSTSVQSNMVHWASSGGVLPDWTWPMPTQTELQQVNSLALGPPKRFAPLLAILRNDKVFVHNKKKAAPEKREIIGVYQRTFQEAWTNGSSIVFGAEAHDHIVNEALDKATIIEDLVELLRPFGGKDVVRVVVTYRAPRVEHLASLWHEFGKPNQSLSDFVRNRLDSMFFMMNSIQLADKFVRHGFSTTIIDTVGLREQNLDLSNIVACEVMRVPCYRNSSIIGFEGKPMVKNHKIGRGEMDLSVKQQTMIDDILHKFDCQFKRFLENHENATILYPARIFGNCTKEQVEQSPFFSMRNASLAIRKLVEH